MRSARHVFMAVPFWRFQALLCSECASATLLVTRPMGGLKAAPESVPVPPRVYLFILFVSPFPPQFGVFFNVYSMFFFVFWGVFEEICVDFTLCASRDFQFFFRKMCVFFLQDRLQFYTRFTTFSHKLRTATHQVHHVAISDIESGKGEG